jgi:WD40 repeat protein
VFHSRTGQLAYRSEQDTGSVFDVAFSPDGLFIASASRESIRLWNSSSARLIRTFDEPTSTYYRSVAFSPDGRLLASSAKDGTVCVWAVETGDEIFRLGEDNSSTNSAVFTPDGKWLLSGGGDGVLHVWNLADGTELKQFDRVGDTIRSVAVHPDCRTVAIAGLEDDVWLWDLWTETTIRLPGHSSYVNAVAFSPSGTHLASASQDHTIRVWALG